jgi:HK97 family phage major capsid protein
LLLRAQGIPASRWGSRYPTVARRGGDPIEHEVATLSVLSDLQAKRREARAAADDLITRAADDGRDLTPDELSQWQEHVGIEREINERVEQLHAEEVRELRAAQARQPGPPESRSPVLTREQSVADWCETRGFIRPEDKPLSFDRYLRGMATGNWTGAEQERALGEGTQAAGGALVPTPLSARVIDLARNATRVFQAGAITVPMTAQTLKLARLTGEGTPGWHAENAAITDADMTFDSVTFTARTLARVIKLSVELFDDSDPSAEDVIARSFAAQLALELDRVALRGSGTPPEPDGVLNQSGITTTTHGANGAAITNYDFWLDAVGTVRGNNFEPTAQIQAPRSETSLSKLKEATTNAYLRPPAALDGIPRLNTKQVPTNLTVGTSTDCSEIYTAQWDQLMIGIRTDFSLVFLRERFLADNMQYAFLAYLRADVQLAQPSAFVVDTGVRS